MKKSKWFFIETQEESFIAYFEPNYEKISF